MGSVLHQRPGRNRLIGQGNRVLSRGTTYPPGWNPGAWGDVPTDREHVTLRALGDVPTDREHVTASTWDSKAPGFHPGGYPGLILARDVAGQVG